MQLSLRDIAEGTGLSKRGVQEALTILSRRKLVGIARQSITDVHRRPGVHGQPSVEAADVGCPN
ncbi:MAG TPA: hypothetical protein VM716_12265 [Gemmatimonadales bacterium]|nr:hypothetical protein [Gemmatimonadales bacterium]